jgi:PAS domain S-box-containing protein
MNIKNNLKYFIVVILFFLIFLPIQYLLDIKIDTLKNDKYQTIAQNYKNLIQQLIDDKSYATLNIAIALSENDSYKQFLLNNKNKEINLQKISLKTRKHSNFKNIWIHLIDANGISRYRSWSPKKDDYLLNVRKELPSLLENPKITSVISVGIFDLTFKSIVPIYENKKFLGLIEVITKFNSIAKKLEKEGIDLVILVDKKYKNQITKPFSKLFIDDYYVANVNAKKDIMKTIQSNIAHFISLENFDIVEKKYFTTTLTLNDFNNKPMAYICIFSNYNNIYSEEIKNFEQFIIIITFLITFLMLILFALYYFFNKSKYTKELENEVKRRTKELIISKKRYEQLFEGSMAIKLIVDPKTKQIIDANTAALNFYGYTKEQILKLKSYDINIDLNNKSEVFNQIVNKDRNYFIFKHKLASGEIKDVEVYSSCVDIDDKKLIYSIIRDITEDLKIKKDYEEKQKLFYQQAKMASMGEMLENIAHQWRQPLSTITTASTGIKLKKEFDSLDDEFLDESLEIILKSSNFLSQTIEDFRNFFKHSEDIETFKVETIIQDALNILKLKLYSNDIHIQIYNRTEYQLQGYKNELIQVFLNILNNSVDAFLQNDIEDKYIIIKIKNDGNYLVVTIQDNANGIDDNIIEKVFEPYFTTKHKSQGTGIGLYMSEQIIEKHFNGEISVKNSEFEIDSKKYFGAQFTIVLPTKEPI